VKPATIKYCLSVLSAVFTTAFNDQITSLQTCAGIKPPTVPPAQRRIITPDQFALIHTALPTPKLRLLVETDVETGLRWGELVEARVRDLHIGEGALLVSRVVIEIAAKFHPTGDRFLIKHYPKDKQPRRLGLSSHIRDLLTAHIAGKAPNDLLFTAPPPTDRRRAGEVAPDVESLGRTDPNPPATPTVMAPSLATPGAAAAAPTAAAPTPPTARTAAPAAPTHTAEHLDGPGE